MIFLFKKITNLTLAIAGLNGNVDSAAIANMFADSIAYFKQWQINNANKSIKRDGTITNSTVTD